LDTTARAVRAAVSRGNRTERLLGPNGPDARKTGQETEDREERTRELQAVRRRQSVGPRRSRDGLTGRFRPPRLVGLRFLPWLGLRRAAGGSLELDATVSTEGVGRLDGGPAVVTVGHAQGWPRIRS